MEDKNAILVNDIHSQLNPTRVREIVPVESTSALQRAVRRAAAAGQAGITNEVASANSSYAFDHVIHDFISATLCIAARIRV